MSADPTTGLRDRMSAALTASMKARDRVAVVALRSALGRVANAEAVHVDSVPRAGAIEQVRVGAGAADAPRRELTEADVRSIVEAEVAEHDHDAQHFTAIGRPQDAARITAQAEVLRVLLDSAATPSSGAAGAGSTPAAWSPEG